MEWLDSRYKHSGSGVSTSLRSTPIVKNSFNLDSSFRWNDKLLVYFNLEKGLSFRAETWNPVCQDVTFHEVIHAMFKEAGT